MLPRLILAAVALSLAGAAPAAADSIAYIQGNDIWLATPDGARKQQVTHTGTYYYVSQADDGTMAALVPGEQIQKLSRTGQVLAEFPTYVSDGSPVGGAVTQFHGPFDPEISPDGSKIAFEYFNDTYDAAPGCNELTVPPCYAYTQSQGVGITNSTGFTGVDAYGLHDGLGRPALDVQRPAAALVARGEPQRRRGLHAASARRPTTPGSTTPTRASASRTSSSRATCRPSSASPASTARSCASTARRCRRSARPTGTTRRSPTRSNVPVAQQCYELPGKFDNTTLAPNSKAMAYATAEGVFVAAIPDNCAPGGPGALVFPGAKHPDWGVADVPPASAFEPRPHRPGSPATGHGPAAAKKLKLAVTRAGKVTVTVPGAGKVTVTAKRKAPHRRQAHQDGQGRREGHLQAQGARQGDRDRRVREADREQDADPAGVVSRP